jgi:hypothetical protein
MGEMEHVELAIRRCPADFAVVEDLPSDRRILFLTDDEDGAREIALELRRRGISAVAYRTASNNSGLSAS